MIPTRRIIARVLLEPQGLVLVQKRPHPAAFFGLYVDADGNPVGRIERKGNQHVSLPELQVRLFLGGSDAGWYEGLGEGRPGYTLFNEQPVSHGDWDLLPMPPAVRGGVPLWCRDCRIEYWVDLRWLMSRHGEISTEDIRVRTSAFSTSESPAAGDVEVRRAAALRRLDLL